MSVLILFNPVLALTNSTIYCMDNQTLVENITVYRGSNMTTLSLPQNCPFGCDNVTNTCRKARIYEYTDYFIAVVVIIFIVLGMAYLSKRIG